MIRFYTQTIQVDVVTVILAGGAQAAVHAANITTTQLQQLGIILVLVCLVCSFFNFKYRRNHLQTFHHNIVTTTYVVTSYACYHTSLFYNNNLTIQNIYICMNNGYNHI